MSLPYPLYIACEEMMVSRFFISIGSKQILAAVFSPPEVFGGDVGLSLTLLLFYLASTEILKFVKFV